MTELVLCVWVGFGGREGKDGGGNRHSNWGKRPRHRQGGKIANAKVMALRLCELLRRDCFSCARSGVFIGKECVPLRLLARDDLSRCESCASVFLGARD